MDLKEIVGFVSLTKEQNEQLPNATVESLNDPGSYPVALGVFHQLHCLVSCRMNESEKERLSRSGQNYLRVQLFPKEGDGAGETDEMREHHKSESQITIDLALNLVNLTPRRSLSRLSPPGHSMSWRQV